MFSSTHSQSFGYFCPQRSSHCARSSALRPNLCGHRATATPADSHPPLFSADDPGHFSGNGHSSAARPPPGSLRQSPFESRMIIQTTNSTPRNPRLFSSRRTSFQLVWLSRLASSTARICRRPSSLMPIAICTAWLADYPVALPSHSGRPAPGRDMLPPKAAWQNAPGSHPESY